LSLPDEQVNALRLDNWLINYCRREKSLFIPRREIQRNVTPVYLRQKSALDITLTELVESGRVRLTQVGRRKDVYVNPALLEGE